MNILLIIEGAQKQDSTFSVLSLCEKSLFLQFSPEFYLQDLNLGEIYADGGIEAVKERFDFPSVKVIDGFVQISLENFIALLEHFFPEGIMNPFEQDQLPLSGEKLRILLSYSNENLDENFPVFHYQKYFLDQLAEKVLRKRNILKLSSIVKYVGTQVDTDIAAAYWTKILARYINKPCQKLTRVIFPLDQTFRMIHDSERSRIKMVDIARNEQYLRSLFLHNSEEKFKTALTKDC